MPGDAPSPATQVPQAQTLAPWHVADVVWINGATLVGWSMVDYMFPLDIQQISRFSAAGLWFFSWCSYFCRKLTPPSTHQTSIRKTIFVKHCLVGGVALSYYCPCRSCHVGWCRRYAEASTWQWTISDNIIYCYHYWSLLISILLSILIMKYDTISLFSIFDHILYQISILIWWIVNDQFW